MKTKFGASKTLYVKAFQILQTLGDPESHFLVTLSDFELCGVSGVLGGPHFHNPRFGPLGLSCGPVPGR